MIGSTHEHKLTHAVLVTSLARNKQLDSATGGGILESNSVVVAVVGEYRLSLLSSLQRDLQLLDDLNGYGSGCGKVPDLLAFLLGFAEEFGDICGISAVLGFAEMELIRDDLGDFRPASRC